MRRVALGLFAFVAGFAVVAYAADAAKVNPRAGIERFLQAIQAYEGITLGASGATISDSYAGRLTYDFPELIGAGIEMGTPCRTSTAVTTTGAAFGDVCTVGVDQVLPADVQLDCAVSAANATKVRLCASGITDSGVVDMPDASYTVRVFDP